MATMLLDLEGDFLNLHLLHDARRLIGVLQGPAAIRATVECIVVGIGNLFRRKRHAFVAWMAGLPAAPAFVLLVLAQRL
jgi:hypothetical protein